ncbi:MAG: RNA-binding S4 domain-containing protein [Oscillospiraceae bacterium]|jgi:ribosomal 50S subunit-recycling heat shock protein|nr:RNA-binding S4 domain-containing protein [Oscillospiraceae bacterium]
MRLDKFLKVSRVIKRRTVAQEAADGGRVAVNGQPAKPGKDVKVGDVLEVRFGANILKLEVLSVDEKTRADSAHLMYREIV